MNFYDLIPFLIFIGIIVFNILKSLAKKKTKIQPIESSQKQSPKKHSGFSKLVETIKAKLEAIKAKKPGEKKIISIWDTLSEGAVFSKNNGVEEVINEEESKPKPLKACEFQREPLEADSVCKKEKKRARHGEIVDVISGNRKSKNKKAFNMSASKMREAIILSEIISKPIGLR